MSRRNAERRAYQRIDTAVEVHGTPEKGGVAARMTANNLSVGGLYCTSTADFPEMTRLAVRLLLPVERGKPSATEPLDLEAVVVRRERLESQSGGEPRYELALFFTRVDDDARRKLSSFVARPTAAAETQH